MDPTIETNSANSFELSAGEEVALLEAMAEAEAGKVVDGDTILAGLRVPRHREPTHPGEILRKEFLGPMGLSQRQLADGIQVPYRRINELINGRRGISPSTALRLARFFGNSAGFWLQLQLRWDLYRAQRSEAEVLSSIQPLERAS